MKNILITNDDGYKAAGLFPLIEALMPLGKVTVVVPANNYSAGSHAITLNKSFAVNRIDRFNDKLKYQILKLIGGRFYTVKGSSADCVRIGYMSLLNKKIDLAASGINDGSNLGTDIIYSATAAAAREAAIEGIASIAISQLPIRGHRADFSKSKILSYLVCKKIISMADIIPKHVFFNLNIPQSYDMINSEIKLASLGRRKYGRRFIRRPAGKNSCKYTIIGEVLDVEAGKNSDVYFIKRNHAPLSAVPLTCALDNKLEWLKKIADFEKFHL